MAAREYGASNGLGNPNQDRCPVAKPDWRASVWSVNEWLIPNGAKIR